MYILYMIYTAAERKYEIHYSMCCTQYEIRNSTKDRMYKRLRRLRKGNIKAVGTVHYQALLFTIV